MWPVGAWESLAGEDTDLTLRDLKTNTGGLRRIRQEIENICGDLGSFIPHPRLAMDWRLGLCCLLSSVRETNYSQILCAKEVTEVLYKGEAPLYMGTWPVSTSSLEDRSIWPRPRTCTGSASMPGCWWTLAHPSGPHIICIIAHKKWFVFIMYYLYYNIAYWLP